MIFVFLTFIGMLVLVLGAYWAFVLRLDYSEDSALRRRLKPDTASRRFPRSSGS